MQIVWVFSCIKFSIAEASLLLRISVSEFRKILKQGNLNHIEITTKNYEFFGYQLLEFLLSTTTNNKIQPIIPEKTPDRIIRAKEVQKI